MPKTLIAVPCFDMVHSDFMESIINLEKPPETFFTKIKNTMIYLSRNIIAANAIEYGFDRVFWVDSDMVLPPDTLLRLTEDMDKGNIDFVSGLYFTRRPPIKPVLFEKLWWKQKDDNAIDSGYEYMWNFPEGLTECAAIGFGCALTSVNLLKQVGEKYGSPFTPLEGMGEDMAFCLRVRDMGKKIYCDTSIKCGHCGQMEFNEDFYKKQGIPVLE